jgi:Uma2 family endonuclease
MASMPALPPFVGELTVDDIDRTPDDGLRYELLDGTVLVSPLPSLLHQRVIVNLLMALHPNCPPDHEVLPRLDWRPDRHTSLQPDVLVLNDRDVETFDPDSMVLALEVTSPQSRRTDTLAKRSRYEEGGVPNYWIVDPAEPSILALELVDGLYRTVGEARGHEQVTLEKPFPVTINPAALIRR